MESLNCDKITRFDMIINKMTEILSFDYLL